MNRHEQEMWPLLLELAEGADRRETAEHAAACPSCGVLLAKARRMIDLASLREERAPRELVTWAKGLLVCPPVRLSLIRTTLFGAGARSAGTGFQALYGAEDLTVRVMYEPAQGGWDVVAQSAGLVPAVAGTELPVDESGRFSFHAADLAATGFLLTGEDSGFEIPSAEEALGERPGVD